MVATLTHMHQTCMVYTRRLSTLSGSISIDILFCFYVVWRIHSRVLMLPHSASESWFPHTQFQLDFFHSFYSVYFLFLFYLFWVGFVLHPFTVSVPCGFLCSPSAGSSIPSSHDHSVIRFHYVVSLCTSISFPMAFHDPQINTYFIFAALFSSLSFFLFYSLCWCDTSSDAFYPVLQHMFDCLFHWWSAVHAHNRSYSYSDSFTRSVIMTSLVHPYTSVFSCYFNQPVIGTPVSRFGLVFYYCY